MEKHVLNIVRTKSCLKSSYHVYFKVPHCCRLLCIITWKKNAVYRGWSCFIPSFSLYTVAQSMAVDTYTHLERCISLHAGRAVYIQLKWDTRYTACLQHNTGSFFFLSHCSSKIVPWWLHWDSINKSIMEELKSNVSQFMALWPSLEYRHSMSSHSCSISLLKYYNFCSLRHRLFLRWMPP